jgi:ribosome-binding protein aMBF1 (putative translation factor)
MTLKNRTIVNADQIRAARAYLNWSQEDLAAAAELSVATIRQIETGHISPRDKTISSDIGRSATATMPQPSRSA